MRLHPAVLVTAVLAVSAGLIVGLVYFRNRHTGTTQELASYLPAEQGVLVSLDLTSLRKAGLLLAVDGSKVEQEPEYVSFVRQTGFNYQEDLESILGWFGKGGTCILLRGRFDWRKLKDYAQAQGGTCRNAFCRMQGSTPQRQISFFPLARNVMALGIGPNEWTATMLAEQKPSRRELRIPERPIWLMAPAESLKDWQNIPSGTRLFAKAMEGAERVELSLAGSQAGTSIELDVSCRTPDEAATLAFQLEGVTRILRSMISREDKTPNPKDLSGVLAAGVFNRVDRRVLGHWPVGREFLESILKDSQ